MGLRDLLFRGKPSAQTATPPPAICAVIEVANVSLATAALPAVPYKVAVEALLTKPPSRRWPGDSQQTVTAIDVPIEACSRYHGQLLADVGFHPVLAAIHWAFQSHRPLVLSPDMLWLLVAQGLANHVNANAEELRPMFVEHSGKVLIVVQRDDFIKGSPENPWAEVLGEFSGQVRNHIGATTHDLFLPKFSTTGAAERAATEVVLLDAMQSFFAYECCSLCGIPQIVLEGTPDDWAVLAERARGIRQFGMGWWADALEPVLDEFVAASRGRAHVPHWHSIYKIDGGSGGPYINGWVTALFPYLRDWETGLASSKNPWLGAGGQRPRDPRRPSGLTQESFPSGLARAPFVWNCVSASYEMEFLGGFVGVGQEADTLRLRPEIGWAVREQPKP